MRAVWIAALIVVAFFVGSYVDHATAWPFGSFAPTVTGAVTGTAATLTAAAAAPSSASSPSPLPSGQSAYVPHYSNDQGLQDAPRAEVMEGRDIDMKRCVTTLVMRRVPQTEAQGTCEQMFGNE